MVSRSLQGRLPSAATASADGAAEGKDCPAWAAPGRAATAAPPSAVPSTARRGSGECLPDCEVIIVLQT
ncbi:hypothetical protein [Streptomyces europaeiscabiei]|uniref:hypothetical protein n=1 Tax=Streptomyces europaeiscabiei TaxID=146819 RepID=UPI0029B29BC4|nr:hypothetical protein [Streptomyces europaeiscabiei]MDX3697969.1 hypothetical protein [Streptomyces europaeiscabiei]WSG19645.1 hypothetical protein OHB30_00215 [Streptomyces europaeiscabiei]WSG28394.1 hypothetical protein OHB30_50115 [Streptomyces europaeiscabiei]